MSDSQPSWIGRTLGNRYQIEELLGRGGMSSVYKASDPNLQRSVAVKIIHPHLSEHPEFVKRFEQEAAAVAQLRHPNIIQVHDFNHEGDAYYMILEHVPGETLEKRLAALKKANLRLPLAETLHILSRLCDAVAYAHERHMIHRDLKPSNVVINLLGEPILMDFGIAKLVGSTAVHTATGATIGTASYMAPEQVLGDNVDHRADIYSLGIMLYEMASGAPPFEGSSAMTVMQKHIKEPVPDIRLKNSNVPNSLVAVLERALAKNPADRFVSAVEMGTALRMVAQHTLEPTNIPVSMLQEAAVSSVNEPAPDQPAVKSITEQARQAPPTSKLDKPNHPVRFNRKLLGSVGRLPSAMAVILLIAVVLGAVFLYPRLFPSIPDSTNMARIPAGVYTVGLGSGGSQYGRTQQLELAEYWIDQYEVTNAQYAEFVADTSADPPSGWGGSTPPPQSEQHPVQGVTWEMAHRYCRWADKRLPTEAEWEVAARGPESLLYPWGDDPRLVTLPADTTYNVGSVLLNRSAFEVYDLAGNVWEWVDKPYAAVADGQRVLRGGAYDFPKDMAARLVGDPNVPTMRVTAGFRCAASEVNPAPQEDVLLQDDFTDPGSGWETIEQGSVLAGYHQPDFYHVQASQPETVSTSFLGGSFDNVTVESAVFVESADTPDGDFRYGLVLRRTGDDYYAFTISPRSSTWQAFKHTEEGNQMLAEGSVNALHGLTTADSLRVDASGTNFVFSINGRIVTQLTDSSFPSGDIGFLVQTFDESRAHIHYDELTVRQVIDVPAGNVLLHDDFTDPNSGWPSIREGSSLAGYHPPDFYHVQSGEPNHRTTAFYGQHFTDLTMEAEIFVESAGTADGDFRYGLVLRRDGEQYYAFLVSPQTNQWRVIKHSDGSEEVLAEGSDESIQGLTGTDRLRVDADGSDMAFYVNGRALIRVQDTAYQQGEIGFIVETLDQTRVHIHYDTLTVSHVETTLAAVPLATAAATATIEPAAAETPAAVEAETEVTPTATPAPALPPATDMVLVDGGTYTVGEATAVALDSFWIDRYEVNNAQFAEFLADTGQTPPGYWAEANVPTEMGDHPVHGVNWDTAVAYCQWANKRLPSEAEWAVAARGPHGWLYPWGDDKEAVNLPASGTYPSGSIPANHSYFNAFDMAGNVWEWVGEPFLPVNAGQKVLRGGANSFQQDLSERLPGDPNSPIMISDAGFRCAASQVEQAADDDLLLHDDFAELESGWWQARAPVDAYFYGYHPTDYYHVQVSDADDCLTVDNEATFANFMAEIDVFVASTDTETGDFRYGLTIRQNDKEFYAFVISPRTKTWRVLKSTPAGMGLMAEGAQATIRGDKDEIRDRLFIIANGPELTFFINGALVSRVYDDAFSDGNVGFIVETLDETYAHVHFDTVAIWQLPEGVAAPADGENTAVLAAVEPICRGAVVAGDTLVNFISHTVAPGESLISIAEQYDVTEEAIMGANGKSIIDPNLIRPGQKLIIPQS